MADRRMSGVQRFFMRFAGERDAEIMEAHSRAWLLRCPNCGFARSVWAMGGIRYAGTEGGRKLVACPRCGQTGWHKEVRAADFPTERMSPWPLVKLILTMMLMIGAFVAAILLTVFWLVGIL